MHDVGNNNNSKSKSSNSNNNYYPLIPSTNTAGDYSSGDNSEQTGNLGGGVVVGGGAVFPVSAAPTIASIPHTMNNNVSIYITMCSCYNCMTTLTINSMTS